MQQYATQEAIKVRDAYENYIAVLNDEINDLVGLAYVHGWRSRNVERGEEARKRIAELQSKTN